LRWDDIFNEILNYETLFQQIVYAIFIVINKEYCS